MNSLTSKICNEIINYLPCVLLSVNRVFLYYSVFFGSLQLEQMILHILIYTLDELRLCTASFVESFLETPEEKCA